jgi:hypothetical protein
MGKFYHRAIMHGPFCRRYHSAPEPCNSSAKINPIVANPDESPIPVGASLLANLMRREKEEFASKLAPTVQVVNLTAGGV